MARERVGVMRERISIESASVAQNAFGEEISTWSELVEVWAAVSFMPGPSREKVLADRNTAFTYVDFTIRRRTDVTTKMRIIYDSKEYNILSITQTPDKFYTILETVQNVV